MVTVVTEATRDAWTAELAEELSVTRACLLRVTRGLGIDTSFGEWPAHRLAMRVELELKRRGGL